MFNPPNRAFLFNRLSSEVPDVESEVPNVEFEISDVEEVTINNFF